MTKGLTVTDGEGKKTKRGSTFPTFAELAKEVYNGQIEVKIGKDGKPETEDSLVLDAITGRNLRFNRLAMLRATNTEEGSMQGIFKLAAKEAAKFGISAVDYLMKLGIPRATAEVGLAKLKA